ncbi:DNA cytosine methyltransferase [Microbacterium sp. SLBN-146]|uniref:DNA cytosine methyltransferase n=1 Tax=Microbacterium sp. SLBN-146 TaxID=2768457 RepID=UPI0011517A46|nr:DNA (cytosine-5)-methyltransferase 1 [Microbacterium sp. SLBN-146]
MTTLRAADLLVGGGGMALGLERGGFELAYAIDEDPDAVRTIRSNREHWQVEMLDVGELSAKQVSGLDLISAGLPSPQRPSESRDARGGRDANDAVISCVNLVSEAQPRAILFESTRSLLYEVHRPLLTWITRQLEESGYQLELRMLEASDFGIAQRRPRVYLVAFQRDAFKSFEWPYPSFEHVTLGETLHEEMSALGWRGADKWATNANRVAPTIVGGSRRHGGADLGPSGTKSAWWRLGIDPTAIADASPGPDDPMELAPRLTLRMMAKLQGLENWPLHGSKSHQARLIASATPPAVAEGIALSIAGALRTGA